MTSPSPGLARRLGTGDAVVIGVGSMIGAGVFAAFGPAARAAGSGLLVGLVIAAVIAYCNATASAQLAAVYPISGGTYVYGRERLGAWWGFTAGWGFVIGKTASCAAMALTFASYVVPGPWWAQRLVGVVGVLGLTALNYRGVSRTAVATRVLVAATLVALAVVVAGIAVAGGAPVGRLVGLGASGHGGVYGVLQSAGLLFFAFAGYARIATMGEEVRDPEHTIPRAIPIALAITVVVYVVVGVAALLAAGPDRLAGAATPLAEAVRAAGVGALIPVVRIGAAVASLGALLALIAGVGRTSLAMARHHDLPTWLAAVHPRFQVPHHAEAALAVLVSALVLISDLRGVIGFSSVGVLVYYAIANAAALTQPAEQRRWPRALHILGIAGCATLVVTLPVTAVLAGLAVLVLGLVARLLLRSRSRRSRLASTGVVVTLGPLLTGLLVTIGLVLSACTGGSPASPSTAAPGKIGPGEITGPLQGAELVHALRAGGLLLWMRHTERDDRSGTVTPAQAASHDCAAQSELTAAGRQHATQIGAAIRALHLPIAAVRTARLCRTQTTGGLLSLVPITDDDRLDASSTWVDRGGAAAEQHATLQVLAEQPPPGNDVVLISSALDIPQAQPAVLGDLGPGETAVFRPGPAGKATLLARIGESAWPTLHG